jgi:predicted lipoprotein with Yx(FWY)xxD motif
MKTLIIAAGLSLAAFSPALADMATANGDVLVNASGMTLYTFDKDEGGVSACYDKCAVAWPPLMADAGAAAEGEFTLTERKDGAMQWAYKGMPLYLWVKDTKTGDMTGDGVNDVWHIARP